MEEKDWGDIWLVERDICFLYHELVEFGIIYADLAYGLVYDMPYWEFLDLTSFDNMQDEEKRFVRCGCLVMLLAMAWDVISGAGTYIVEKIPECQQAVSALMVEDDEERQLISTVKLGLELAARGIKRGKETGTDLEELSVWAHRTLVYGRQNAHGSQGKIKAPGITMPGLSVQK